MSIAIDVQAVRDSFSLNTKTTIPDQGISALYGPSGAGKTTLLRILAGLEPSSGTIKFGSTVWQDATTFVPTHQRRIGFVFQGSNLFQHLSVKANLEYAARRVKPEHQRFAMDEIIALLDLESYLSRDPKNISGGEKQRVAIARALASSPRLLMLDEPLAALDQSRKDDILPLLKKIGDTLDIPMLYVSHAIDEVARIADHLILINNGNVMAAGAIQELLTSLDLPLARDVAGGATLETIISGYDEQYDLTQVSVANETLRLPGQLGEIGTPLRLLVLAKDVSITTERSANSSILNILPATIDAILTDTSAQAIVKLNINGAPLLARITHKSVATLALVPGSQVYAQVKTVALTFR